MNCCAKGATYRQQVSEIVDKLEICVQFGETVTFNRVGAAGLSMLIRHLADRLDGSNIKPATQRNWWPAFFLGFWTGAILVSAPWAEWFSR